MRPQIIITHGEELQAGLDCAARRIAGRIVGQRLPLAWRIHRALLRAGRRLARALGRARP